MKTLLLTGASGCLGWNIAKFPQTEWQIIGTYWNNPKGMPTNITGYQLDLTNSKAVHSFFKTIKPDAVLHTAAISSTSYCEKHPQKTYPINVSTPTLLAKICNQYQIPYIFTSSAQVFDGLQSSYSEIDTPNPLNKYGQQKLAAEQAIQQVYNQATICRIPVLFGWHHVTASSFFISWFKALKNNQPITAFEDEYRSFLSYEAAAQGLFILLNQRATGIYHLGGGEVINRYDFAKKMQRIFNFPNATIIKSQQKNVNMVEPLNFNGSTYRPPRLHLDSQKIMDSGYVPRNIDWELRRLHKTVKP